MKSTSVKEKIFVGISGGVDSSVAAYVLQQEGYDVQGIFVKTWSPEWLPCTWIDEKRDAMRVCAKLGIPFHFLDAEEAYKEGVAKYMIDEYRAGRTPNPDVLCNRVIKFGAMWEYAKAHGAQKIATGHYAQSIDGKLLKGIDVAKDQSYFLWMLTKNEIPNIVFPIAAMEKSMVRDIAKKAKLFTAAKKDSQGICFLGDVDMKEFLRHYIEEKEGNVIAEDGAIIGTHPGVWFFTLGERHGFTITKRTTDQAPYYVIGKDVTKNTLTVSSNIPEATGNTVQLREENWLQQPIEGKVYDAQIRYHGSLLQCTIAGTVVVFRETNELIPLGQSVVVYEGDVVIGGGIIDSISI